MSLMTEKTVRDFVLENPAARPLFEQLGIDYCCGGSRSLEQACGTAGVPLDAVMERLNARPETPGERDWREAPLTELIVHIQHTHHRYTRGEIARLGPLFDKVCGVHGANHPELHRMRAQFRGLSQELTTHMMKEEAILFPYIARMEEAVIEGGPLLPPPFGTVQNPVDMMMHEHDSAGEALRDLREASQGYAAPPDACLSYQTLYEALAAFEADLHQHIHLENNILFPRAIAMEESH